MKFYEGIWTKWKWHVLGPNVWGPMSWGQMSWDQTSLFAKYSLEKILSLTFRGQMGCTPVCYNLFHCWTRPVLNQFQVKSKNPSTALRVNNVGGKIISPLILFLFSIWYFGYAFVKYHGDYDKDVSKNGHESCQWI